MFFDKSRILPPLWRHLPLTREAGKAKQACSAVLKVPLVKGGWPAGPGGLVPSARIEQESRGEPEGPQEGTRNDFLTGVEGVK